MFLYLGSNAQNNRTTITSIHSNLIINPGFEDPEREPKYQDIGIFNLNEKVEMTPSKGYNAGYELSNGWSMPTNGTSDYLSGKNCSAFGWPIMQARTGNGRGGFNLGGKNQKKEYLEVEFTSPLEKNKKYCLSFYIAHEKFSNYAVNEVDAFFSFDKIRANTNKNLNLSPHITLKKNHPITHNQGWVEVCGTYVAKGGEKYLTVGNFNKDVTSVHVKNLYDDYKKNGGKQGFMHPLKNEAYYYIDDFSLLKQGENTYQCEEWKINDTVPSKNWVFLIDASGSMASIDKLPSIKLEMQQIAAVIPPGSTLSIATFGSKSGILLEGADMSDSWTISNVLNNIKADGGSAIPYGFMKTVEVARRIEKNAKPTEIFLFTDGAVSGGKAVLDTIQKLRKTHPEIKVNTIQFGETSSKKKILVKIAEEGNGMYYNTKKTLLRSILQNNIGLEFVKKLDCSNFNDCCQPQKFIDQYSYNNTTFLLDVSGSMKHKDKLPLLQQTLIDLSDSMRVEDKLSIVQFSATANVVLEPTSYQNKEEIKNIIHQLHSNGNTNLEKGIKEAVDEAIKSYKPNYNNTILLATDGKAEYSKTIKKSIKKASRHHIHTSVLHFSRYEGKELKKIAKEGNGTYHQINDTNLWDEFSHEIKRKEMGPDFYAFDSTYSSKKPDQISAYRTSKIMFFVAPVLKTLYRLATYY